MWKVWDISVFRAINGLGVDHPVFDGLMLFLSDRNILWAAFAMGTLFCLFKKSKRIWLFWMTLIATVVTCDVVTHFGAKEIFERLRPCYAIQPVRTPTNTCGGRYGFPSNHAVNSMAIALFFFLEFRKSKFLWLFLIPLAVGFSRIYLGVHYPTDVLFGYLQGAFIAYLFYQFKERTLKPFFTTPSQISQ
jgi:undecaprenyl-diphosphatase